MQPTQVLQRSIRRLKLTTKQTNKGYYKGTGSGSMGRHTSRGKYIVEYQKVRTYVCPDLTGFDLTPFVTKRLDTRETKTSYPDKEGPLSGKLYLEKWKEENGRD